MLAKKILGGGLVLLLLATFSACKVDESYDLDNIDTEVTLAKGISFPLPQFKAITLEQIINDQLGEDADNEYLKTAENGDYYLEFSFDRYPATGYEGITLNAADMKVPSATDQITINQDFPTMVTIPSGVPIATAQTLLDAAQGNGYAVNDGVSIDFKLNSIPSEVVAFKKVVMDGDLTYTLSSTMPFNYFVLKSGATITFPDWLVIDNMTAPANLTLDTANHVITATADVIFPATGMAIQLHIAALEVEGGVDLKTQDTLAGQIALNGDVYLDLAYYSYSDGTSTTVASDIYGIRLENQYVVNDLLMTSADVKLNTDDLMPEFGGEQAYDIDGMPEFLSDDTYKFTLSHVQTEITVENTSPCAFDLQGTFFTLKNGATAWSHTMAKQPVAANKTTTIQLDEKDLTGIGGAFSPAPDQFGIKDFSATLTTTDYVTVVPGVLYGASFSGKITAPLAFTSDSQIRLNEEVELELELKKDDVQIPTLILKMDMVNTLPFSVNLDVVPLGEDGNQITGAHVTVDKKIASGSLESPVTTPVQVKLEFDKVDIKIAKLQFGLVVEALDGVVVNKAQGIQMKDASLLLPDGVTVSLDKDDDNKK